MILKPAGIGAKKGVPFQLYLSTKAQNFFHTVFSCGALAIFALVLPVTFSASSSMGPRPAAIAFSSSTTARISLLNVPFSLKLRPSSAIAAICVGWQVCGLRPPDSKS